MTLNARFLPSVNITKPAIVGLMVILISACSKEAEPETQQTETLLKPVRTMTVHVGGTSTKSFTGVVDAAQTAELGFRVNGELKVINVKEGSPVKKGDVLAQLDQTDFKISLDAAKAEYKRAQSEFNRAKSLIKQGAISQADYDKLNAQLSAAKANLSSAEQNLKYTTLKAPFSGVVAKQYISNFEKISASEKFAAIQDLSAFEIRINIPESVMIRLKRTETQPDVFAIFDGNDKRRYPLTFKEVSIRADEKTQTYAVKFIMDAPTDINVLPGMSTKVIAVDELSNQSADLYVPAHAVLEDSSGRYVYLAQATENNQASIARRGVVVGSLNENGIQVVQGLKEGDNVVTAGMSQLSEGMAVRLMGGAQ